MFCNKPPRVVQLNVQPSNKKKKKKESPTRARRDVKALVAERFQEVSRVSTVRRCLENSVVAPQPGGCKILISSLLEEILLPFDDAARKEKQ